MATHWPARFTPWAVSNKPTEDESSRWGHPLYWAKSSDPTYTIVDSRYACGQPYASSCPRTVQIPDGAQHALARDGHLAVIEPNGHTEVDFWQVGNANPLSGGGTITVHDYGALDLNGSGCCGGSTAADQGLAAGAIRGPELAAGAIRHALSVSETCSNGRYVPPATGGGAGGCASAPPVGARLQLKMSDSQIAALGIPGYQKIILTAMAHYGMYITDTGGSPMDLDYEPAIMYTSFGNASNTVMSYLQTHGYSDPAMITIGLPWTDFQIVSTCYAARSC
ncbi:MAG: hypothetical protein ACTHMY_11320 [Solirubrobacteraceae bacterium]